MARDDRHFHFFSSELFAGTAGSFHLFLIIIPLVSLEPIRFDACQRDRRKPCVQNLAWLLWTTRRGALAVCHAHTQVAPVTSPCRPDKLHRRTHAGLGTGVRNPIALSRRRLAGNGPVDRPRSLSSSPTRSRGGWGSSVHNTNKFCGVKKKIGIFLSPPKNRRPL